MNYIKFIEAILESKKSKGFPSILLWGVRHLKLLIGLIIGFVVLMIVLIIGVLIAAFMFFTRNTPQVPSPDGLIQSGRQYLDQQFGLENQKLDQLQKEVEDIKGVLTSTPTPAPSPTTNP